MANNLPPYVDLPGSRTFQPPYLFNGTNAQFFILEANYDQLKQVTDYWLNSVPGSEYTFKPLLPFVACCPMWIDKIICTNPPDSQMGWMRESDFNFSYFVSAHKNGKFDHLACVFPYLVVDTPLTMATGREVFGFRKSYGTLEYVAGTYQPAAATTWVWKEFAPENEIQLAEVARIIPPPAPPETTGLKAELKGLLKLAEAAVGDLMFDAAVAVDHLINHLTSMSITMAYLMPVRDIEFPLSAAYTALIETPLQITNLHSGWMLPDGYTIQLTDYASYPLITDLGIKVDANNVAKPILSYQVYFDSELQTGKVLACGGRTAPSP